MKVAQPIADIAEILMKELRLNITQVKACNLANNIYHAMPDTKWSTEKSVFDHEFIMITATWIKDRWNCDSWSIIYVESGEPGPYYALCDIYGEEWGERDEMAADYYQIIELPKKHK